MASQVVAETQKDKVVASQNTIEAKDKVLESIVVLKADLQKSGITPETKIPGYQSELKATQESLQKQGKDPKYAE